MKQFVRFLYTITLCGTLFVIPAGTISPRPLEPTATTTSPHASSMTIIPTDSPPAPTEVGDQNLLVGSREASAVPQAKTDNPLSTGNQSEADYVSMGREAKGQIILNEVPLVNQQNYTSCGEAAFAMGWNYRHLDQVLDILIVETSGLEIGVYFTDRLPGPGGYLGTSPTGMEAIADFFADQYRQLPPTAGNINLDNGEAYAELEARGLLYHYLSTGDPVIIEVTDAIGSPSKTYNDSHYVIVTGMNFDSGRVTYNDPYLNLSMDGKYSGYGRTAEWSDIWASWSNNKDVNPGEVGHPGRGWYMVIH